MTKASSSPSKRDVIVQSLMQLAASRPWDDIEITDIAKAANISLLEFREHFPSKGAVLAAFSRMIDQKVLEGTSDVFAGGSARERVFDIFVRRLDALTPYKEALRRIASSLSHDPVSLLAINKVMLNSQRFMLAAVGLRTEDSLGTIKLQGAVIVFAEALRTWLQDDDPSLARTLARLDRGLKRSEFLLNRADDLRRLTGPLRILGRAFTERDYTRADRSRQEDGETRDPAAAI